MCYVMLSFLTFRWRPSPEKIKEAPALQEWTGPGERSYPPKFTDLHYLNSLSTLYFATKYTLQFYIFEKLM